MPEPRFRIASRPLWDDLDVGASLEESDEEAKEYDRQIGDEIRWKVDGADGPLHLPHTATRAVTRASNVADEPPTSSSIQYGPGSTAVTNTPSNGASGAFRLPSLRRSTYLNHATPRLTISATLPAVPTPRETTTPLPDPRRPLERGSTSRLRSSTVVDTPDHIDSPVDTPVARSGLSAHARTEHLSPLPVSVPVPLGNTAFSSLRGKKDYQTLTKTFDLFNKSLAKITAPPPKKGRASSRSIAGLGGKIFEGLRFCIPPELGQVAKHKQRWDIIAKLGGRVTLSPDTAITHVIYDRPSASVLCRELGLQTLSELPAGTVCVKWEWIVNCKLAGRVLDTKTWLSFPKTPFTRSISTITAGTSRFVDISDQLRGKSISISKKRAPTASESETESPKKVRPNPITLMRSATISRYPLAGPSVSKCIPSIATNHVLPTGPGWEEARPGAQDGLDEMISGVKNGTVNEEEETLSPGFVTKDLPQVLEKDGPESEDESGPYKCQQKNDGVSNKGPNEWLAKRFDDMHDMYQVVPGKSFFSIRQYQQAASILRRTQFAVTSGAQALKIKGIGSGIADRIDEFISGGPGRQYYEDNDQMRIIATFKDIYGVGRTFANELYKKGARSIEDLRQNDYGLTPGQMIGVQLYDDLIARIPREECRQLFDIILAEARYIDPKVWIEIMGSYRRGQEDSGDVDILITRDTADGLSHTGVLYALVSRLKKRGIITHDLGLPHDWKALEAKWMGVGRLSLDHKHRRIDILCIPFEQWGAALIYFTGNNIFNRSLRLYARKKGYSLNQRGLSVGVIRDKQGAKMTEGEIIASRTEQEIFDVLGLRWRHPHHRRP